jgi:hypothetical protein
VYDWAIGAEIKRKDEKDLTQEFESEKQRLGNKRESFFSPPVESSPSSLFRSFFSMIRNAEP